MLLNTIDNILDQSGAPKRAPREIYICSACGVEQTKGTVCRAHPYRPAISKTIHQYWIEAEGYDLPFVKLFFDSSHEALHVIRKIKAAVVIAHHNGEFIPYFQVRYGDEFPILFLKSKK